MKVSRIHPERIKHLTWSTILKRSLERFPCSLEKLPPIFLFDLQAISREIHIIKDTSQMNGTSLTKSSNRHQEMMVKIDQWMQLTDSSSQEYPNQNKMQRFPTTHLKQVPTNRSACLDNSSKRAHQMKMAIAPLPRIFRRKGWARVLTLSYCIKVRERTLSSMLISTSRTDSLWMKFAMDFTKDSHRSTLSGCWKDSKMWI